MAGVEGVLSALEPTAGKEDGFDAESEVVLGEEVPYEKDRYEGGASFRRN